MNYYSLRSGSVPLILGLCIALLSLYEDVELIRTVKMHIHDEERDEQRISLSDESDTSRVSSKTSKKQKTLHILYGLSGSSSAFIDEFEVSLKSVLYNSPIDSDMDVHLIVDQDAHSAILDKFNESLIQEIVLRNRVSIIFYVVSEKTKERYRHHVLHSLPVQNLTLNARVGVGTLFRLFPYEILPNETGPVVYMDSDVVVFSNLNALHEIIDPSYMYQVGYGTKFVPGVGVYSDVCSGFMIINLKLFHDFWRLLNEIPAKFFPRAGINDLDDQVLLKLVKLFHRPRYAIDLPSSWHVHMAHGFRYQAHLLRRERSDFGMMHFNGWRPKNERWWDGGVWTYCNESEDCRRNVSAQQEFRESWNLAEFYVHLPWNMVRSQSKALSGSHGHPLSVRLGARLLV